MEAVASASLKRQRVKKEERKKEMIYLSNGCVC